MIDMEREQLGELLSAHLDGEVDERERAFVERILESDADARAWYESLRTTAAGIRALPHHPAPSGMDGDILASVERHTLLGSADAAATEERLHVPWVGVLSAAAVLIAATLVGINRYDTWFGKSGSTDKIASARREAAPSTSPAAPTVTVQKRADLTSTKHLNLEDKLEAGADRDAVLDHDFSDESVVLTLSVHDSRQVDQASRRLSTYLARLGIGDAASDAVAQRTLRKTPFYVAGRAGVNYSQEAERQLLLRVPVTALEELVDSITPDLSGTKRVALRAGSLTFDGRDAVRETFRRVVPQRTSAAHAASDPLDRAVSRKHAAAATKPRDTAKRAEVDEDKLVAGVFEALGITPELLQEPTPSPEPTAVADAAKSRDDMDEAKSSRDVAATRTRHRDAAGPSVEVRTNKPLATETLASSTGQSGRSARRETGSVPLVTVVVRLTTSDAESHKPDGDHESGSDPTDSGAKLKSR